MGYIALTVLLVLAGCGADPAKYGITGAVTPTAPAASSVPSNGVTEAPGFQLSPSTGSTTGSGKFWGYN
jgi:hypothetical protein